MYDALSTGYCFHDFVFDSLLTFPPPRSRFPHDFLRFVQVRALDYHDVRPVKDQTAPGALLTYSRLQQLSRLFATPGLPGRFGTNRWFISTPNGMTREEPSIGVHPWLSPAWCHE